MRSDLYIEYLGQKTDHKQLVDIAKEIWKSEGNLVKDIETLELYFKPDEMTCYYVINQTCTGNFEV